MGVAAATRARVHDDIVGLVHRGVGLDELSRGVGRTLRRAVPFEGTCLLTMDPATLLPTAELVENGLPPEATVRMGEIELGEPDVNKFRGLAHAPVPAASLSGATAGDLDRSRRQREVRGPHGFGDELRAVLTGPTGTWGALTLLREADRPHFTPADVRFVAGLAPTLADGVRRATLLAEATQATDVTGATDDGGRSGTGFLVVAADDSIEMANPAAERWIDQLAPARGHADSLPVAIRAVVTQTRRIAAGAGAGDALASARVHTPTGHWVIVRGSLVGPGTGNRVAILLEEARPAELASAIADTYAFTERERAITELVARGLSTNAIADHLFLSAYTVQDHLKTIFGKTGTGSRGELVAHLFLDHHPPRPTSRDLTNGG